MITDPIADLLTRLRNAIQAGKRFVQVKNSRVKHGMVQVMHHSGYLADYRVEDPDSWKSTLHIGLKYNHKLQKNAITHLKRVSRPGLRIYRGAGALPHVLNGLGIAIISTSQGIMSDKQARKAHLGGEVLCHIY